MKLDIGYFFKDEYQQPFREIVDDYQEKLHSIYFPWVLTSTDRAQINATRGYVDWSAQETIISDLKYARQKGIKIDLLFNANCYGEKSISLEFASTISSIVDYIQDKVGGLDCVTTTSYFVAWVIKNRYPHIKVKASVNMRIGTVYGMEQARDFFDIFLIQRDYNRDFAQIESLLLWGKENGKEMRILANSGCMRLCAGQIFHDSLCAHDSEIQNVYNDPSFPVSLCAHFYGKPENQYKILQNTWIRPEDLHHYEPYFSSVKLATRTAMHPRNIIEAYATESFKGNLLELFEPNHVLLYFPTVLYNERFPEDWFEKTSSCNGDCGHCDYCKGVYERITTRS